MYKYVRVPGNRLPIIYNVVQRRENCLKEQKLNQWQAELREQQSIFLRQDKRKFSETDFEKQWKIRPKRRNILLMKIFYQNKKKRFR